MLQSLLKFLKPDVALIQETHLKEQHRVYITGYRCYRDDRGVGTAILVKEKYRSYQLHTDLTTIDSCSIQMRVGNIEWSFSSIYIPCGSTGPALRPDLEKLNGTQNIIVGGDLNARHTSWCVDTNTTGVVLRKWLDKLDTTFTLVSPDNQPTTSPSKITS